jgi:hypothetical protein
MRTRRAAFSIIRDAKRVESHVTCHMACPSHKQHVLRVLDLRVHPFLTSYHHHPLWGMLWWEPWSPPSLPIPFPHPSYPPRLLGWVIIPSSFLLLSRDPAPLALSTLLSTGGDKPTLFSAPLTPWADRPPCFMYTLWKAPTLGASTPQLILWKTPSLGASTPLFILEATTLDHVPASPLPPAHPWETPLPIQGSTSHVHPQGALCWVSPRPGPLISYHRGTPLSLMGLVHHLRTPCAPFFPVADAY